MMRLYYFFGYCHIHFYVLNVDALREKYSNHATIDKKSIFLSLIKINILLIKMKGSSKGITPSQSHFWEIKLAATHC